MANIAQYNSYQTPPRNINNDQNTRSTSPFYKYNNKCVCDICNCNTHKCPKEYPPQKKIIPVSHQDYKYPSNFQKSSPIRPQTGYTPTKADPNHFKTSNQLNYQPNYFENELKPDRLKKGGIHQTSSNYIPKIPGIYDTEYKQGVAKEKEVNYIHPNRPKEKPSKPLPFDGRSTYRENYHSNKPLDHNTPIKAKDNLLTDRKTPFNSKSIYNQEYLAYPIEKGGGGYYNRNKESHIVTPEQVGKVSSQYQSCYPGYKPEAYMKTSCPMKYLPAPPRYLNPGKNHIVYFDELNKWN